MAWTFSSAETMASCLSSETNDAEVMAEITDYDSSVMVAYSVKT